MKKKSLMLVMLTLVLALGRVCRYLRKTKVKTYKVTYVLNGGTNNKRTLQNINQTNQKNIFTV